MADPTSPGTPAKPASVRHSELPSTARTSERQLSQWGGIAAVAGVILMLATAVVVGSLGLPDASDPETLTDFAEIKSGRIAEHFLYLGALMLFALHVLVLQRLLRFAHPAAALFGAAFAEFGLLIMAASSLLHVSTSPLADLYTEPGATPEELQAIEYAWHGAQSVFDTMLTTGVLLVPIGIVLLGVAMRSVRAYGPGISTLTICLGTLGIVGATIAVVDPGSAFSAASVLTIVVFFGVAGWRMLRSSNDESHDIAGEASAPVD